MSRTVVNDAERHRIAGGVPHAQLEDVLVVDAEAAVGLRRHAERAPEQIEVVDVGRSEIGLQRREHVRHVDAEHLRLDAIDVEIELRRRVLEHREHLLQARRLVGLGHHRADGLLQCRRSRAAAILHHHAEAAGAADAAHRRRRHDENHARPGWSRTWPATPSGWPAPIDWDPLPARRTASARRTRRRHWARWCAWRRRSRRCSPRGQRPAPAAPARRRGG